MGKTEGTYSELYAMNCDRCNQINKILLQNSQTKLICTAFGDLNIDNEASQCNRCRNEVKFYIHWCQTLPTNSRFESGDLKYSLTLKISQPTKFIMSPSFFIFYFFGYHASKYSLSTRVHNYRQEGYEKGLKFE